VLIVVAVDLHRVDARVTTIAVSSSPSAGWL